MPLTLHLRVLGTAGLWADGDPGEPPRLGPGKPLALVTYLALSPRRTETREHLIDLLWADAEPEAARRNLRQSLYQIRRLLGEDAVTGDGDRLTLACPVRVDRQEFLEAVEAGDLQRAVSLYSGPFFPAFAAAGGAAFEHWADIERQRLRGTFLRSLEALGREAVAQRRARDAVALARRLLEAAPERETGWRLILEALIGAGDWFRAGAEADACEAALRDLGRNPEPATLALIRAARQAPPSAGGEARLVVEMVGREAEFSAIVGAWETASRGRMRHLHVVGSPGIGKTRLLLDAAARMTAAGARVVRVRANQGERGLPYAAAGDLTRQLAALPGATAIAPATAGILLGLDPGLSALFPGARPAAYDGDELLRLRALAVADLLAAVADERPVTLLVDDLHWADGASRSVLAGLAVRAATSPVLLLTASRPVADALVPLRPDETMTLRPLDPVHVGSLMESAAPLSNGLRASGLVEAIHEATGGNPLLVLNLLRLALDQEWLALTPDAWEARDLHALRSQLRTGSVLDRRIAGLSAHERRVLLTLAIAGAPVEQRIIEATSRRFGSGPGPALRALEAAGHIATRGEAWEMAHDLVAEQVLEGATRDELRGAREALGTGLLEEAGESDDRLLFATRLLAAAGSPDLARAFASYARERRSRGDASGVRTMVLDVLGPEADTAAIASLARTIPLRLRITRPMLVSGLAVAGMTGAVLGMIWLKQPASLAVEQMPPSWAHFEATPPVVSVLDRMGGTVGRLRDSVAVSVVRADTGFALSGVTKAPVRNGRATFAGLYARPGRKAYAALRFSLGTLTPVVSDSFVAGFEGYGLRLVDGMVNGQTISPGQRRVTIAPGDSVTGYVTLSETIYAGEAAVLLAIIPQWGDRRTSFYTARSLPSSAANYHFRQRIAIPGPARRGVYGILFVFATETEAKYIASATNWTLGTPLWNDGNDLYEVTPAQREDANRAGGVMWTFDQASPDNPWHRSAVAGMPMPQIAAESAWRYRNRVHGYQPMTTIEVEVR